MKKAVFMVILLFAVTRIIAQEAKTGKQPDVKTKVNKEYDDQGNLIRFDSTYVKTWSSDSVVNGVDFEELEKQMQEMFGRNFPGFFSDSTKGEDPFNDLQQEFFKRHQDFMNNFSFDRDSGRWNEIFPSNMDSLHQQIMKRFGHFFQSDSLQLEDQQNIEDFDFFFSPDEMEKIRKELEQPFDEPQKGKDEPEKIGGV